MKLNFFEEQFLDYIEGNLSETEIAEFENALKESPELQASFEAYKSLLDVEQAIASESHSTHPSFEVKVMERVRQLETRGEPGLIARLFMQLSVNQKRAGASIATLATLALVIKILADNPQALNAPRLSMPQTAQEELGKEAKPEVSSKQDVGKAVEKNKNELKDAEVDKKLNEQVLTKDESSYTLPLTSGNRALSIQVPNTSGMEGYVQPGAHVDIVVTRKEGEKVVSQIIASDARIISAGGDSTGKGVSAGKNGQTLTLDTSASDALKIQAAKQIGEVSVILRGDSDRRNSSVVLNDLIGSVSDQPSANGKVRVGGKEYIIGRDGNIVAMEGSESRANKPQAIGGNAAVAEYNDLGVGVDAKSKSTSTISALSGSTATDANSYLDPAAVESSSKAAPSGNAKVGSGTGYAIDGTRAVGKDQIIGRAIAAPISEPYTDLVTRSQLDNRALQIQAEELMKRQGQSREAMEKEFSETSTENFKKLIERAAVEDNSGFQAELDNRYRISPVPPNDHLGYGASNTEQYNEYVENERIRASDEALSTFSIDVDTGSYTNARRFLINGQLPPANSIRIEEFINYFDYNYPSQSEKPFGLTYEVAPSPLEKDRLLLKLGIKAKENVNSEKPWNLVFLVDVSGSMGEPNKLPLVQKSLSLLVQKMKAQDKIALVVYAGNAGLVLDSTPGTEKTKILDAIERLNAGGSTNGAGGISLAYEIAQRNRIEGSVNRVVLATDGDFNVGVSSEAELIKLIEEKRKGGVTLTTLGFGQGNLQDGKMEQLANKGNGNYFYIDSFKEARKVLETQLTGTMEVVAKDVKLQIEFNPQHVAQYRLIGYENRKLKKEDFNNDQIDAGEIGSGHTVTALYEIVLSDSELAKRLNVEYRYQQTPESEKKVQVSSEFGSELAFLKVRYKEPEGTTSQLLQFPIDRSNVKASAQDASSDFRFAAAVAYFAEILRQSKFATDLNLKEVAELAQASKGEDKFGYRQEFIELVKNAQAVKR